MTKGFLQHSFEEAVVPAAVHCCFEPSVILGLHAWPLDDIAYSLVKMRLHADERNEAVLCAVCIKGSRTPGRGPRPGRLFSVVEPRRAVQRAY